MSRLIGTDSERFSLARAIDALAEAARQAGRPGLVWVVGLLYPSVTLGLFSVANLAASSGDAHDPRRFRLGFLGWLSPDSWLVGDLLKTTSLTVCAGLICFPLFRLVAGLARVSPPEAWREACAGRRTPRVRTLWKSGAGMTLSVIGLWIQLVVMVVGAFVVVLWPAELVARPFLQADSTPGALSFTLAALFVGPIALLFVSYALSISVLTQLALHSLAHNRRGIGSALLHGWRIMRHDVPATVRAVVADLVLSLALILLWRLIGGVVQVETVNSILLGLLSGFAGVARAGYWARAYRALGGLSPDDGVPGLAPA